MIVYQINGGASIKAKADTVSYYSYLSMYIVPVFDIILIVFSLTLNMDVFIRVFVVVST